MVDFLSAPNAAEDLAFLVQAIVRNDDPDRFTNHLGRRIPEHPLCGLVPGRNDAVQVLTDDRVVTRLDDGGEPPCRAIVARQEERRLHLIVWISHQL